MVLGTQQSWHGGAEARKLGFNVDIQLEEGDRWACLNLAQLGKS